MTSKTLVYIAYTMIFTFMTYAALAEKHGLIIAIGDYPTSGGWTKISSPNDVPHVNAALHSMGFEDDNITLIQDQQATKQGILGAINTLTSTLKNGDIVYIHFSGHGQQVMDDNGDEIDQLDESIVPYDSPMKFEAGVYQGENLIRDDEIGKLMDKMRAICGKDGQVILVLDSCHSGTGVRGMGKVRGTSQIMAPDSFNPNITDVETSANISAVDKETFAPMACFFGASAKELNYETLDNQSKPVGSLTFAISTILANMKTDYTFEDVFTKIKLKMKTLAPRQNPQWEGPSNVKVLGGKLQRSNSNFNVTAVNSDQTIKADLGTFLNIFGGTKVEIVSRDNGKVLSRGEVTSAYLTESIITIDSTLDMSNNDLYQVRIVEPALPPLTISMTSSVKATSQWNELANNILQSPIINLVTENADVFITESDDKSIELSSTDGISIYKSLFDHSKVKDIQKEIESKLQSFLQGKFLRSYDNESNKFDFNLSVVSVDCTSEQTVEEISNTDMKIKLGTCIRFKITNNGINGAYFSLLDIQPDNVINVVIPAVELGYTAEEYYLKAGESFETNYVIEIGEPLGEETLKLIISKQPQDLSSIIMTQGNSQRGINTLDPFEQMLQSTYKPVSMRGTKVRKPKGEELATSTLFFKIVK